jgi:hypothetical protein
VEGSTATPRPSATIGQDNQGTLINVGQPSHWTHLNSQQPFYQTMSYGPNIHPMGSDMPHGPVPDILFPRIVATTTHQVRSNRENNRGMTDDVRDQITRTLREFGFTPKGCARVYQKSYPEYFDTIPYPWVFRVPDFIKFTSDDTRTTYVHVGQFVSQVNNIDITDVHKVRLFPLSLSNTAFN